MRYRLGTLVAAIAMALSASSAHAAPLDLDPSFGTGGIATGSADLVGAVGAPVAQPDGKVVVVGRRRGTDAIVLQRFTAAGALDPGFGTSGEVTTDLLGPPGHVAVADAGGGALHVVGPSTQSGGKLALYRVSAAGAVVGKATANVPGSVSRPTAAVVAPDGSTYVALNFDCGSGVQCFGVARFRASGLDPAFGGQGYVKTKIGSVSEPAAIDVVTGTDGKDRVLLAGAAGADTAVVRYLATGQLDTSFDGDGIKILDASGNGGEDHAEGLVVDSAGRAVVVGPAGPGGYAARLTSGGALDTSFGAAGYTRTGLTPAGTSWVPAAVTADSTGRLLVAGTALDAATRTTKWVVSRLLATGAPDPAAPSAVLSACANTAGNGPVGVRPAAGRVLVSGACGPDGRTAVARLLANPPFTGGVNVAVSDTTGPAGYEHIPIAGLDPSAVLGGTTLLQETSLRANPTRPNPTRPNPTRPNPTRPNPLIDSPLRDPGIASQILLTDFPLAGTTWEDVLTGKTDRPIQTLTLADVFAITPTPSAVAALTLGDVDLDRSPLRNVSAGAFLLGLRPLSALPAPAGGWCAYLAGQPATCENGQAAPDRSTLVDLELAGNDFRSYFDRGVSLKAPTLGSGGDRAPLSYVKLTDLDLARTPFGDVDARLVGDLLACGGSCTGTLADRQEADPRGFSTADVGALVARLPIADGAQTVLADATLGDVLNGLVSPDAIPFEAAPARSLLDRAAIRADELQTWTVSTTVDCAAAPGLTATVDTPDDARIVPGSAALTIAGATRSVGAPSSAGVFDLAPACEAGGAGLLELTFRVEPGSNLGPQAGSVALASGTTQTTAPVRTTVDDSKDPGSTFDDTQPIGDDRLVTGHIADGGDVDHYTFPAPKPGSKVTFTLSQLDADYDLSVYGAGESLPSSPTRPNPTRPNPTRPNAGVPDASRELTDPSVVAPDTVQDIPTRPNPTRPNPTRPNELRTNSITRDLANEAASLVMRERDEGTQLTVAVTAYNGASSAKPYVLRAKVAPAPPEPPCMTLPALSGGASPSTLPTAADIRPQTQALILVNGQRLAARHGDASAAESLAAARDLAAATNGLVVPLDVPETDAAYSDLDDSPCSPEAANAVVAAVNGAVDTVRQRGGGLPELRSILVVGSDQIVPQARVPDRTVLANEADFADDIVFDGRDNPQSRAARRHYLLSDDPLGDFDPPTDGFYVPDVALGRLVETPEQIAAQIRTFLSAEVDGRVTPTRAFTTGYDFLSDGAQAMADALAGAVPSDSAAALINETWTAQEARGRTGAAGAAFVALNGHFDQYRALSAAGNANGTDDLFGAGETAAPDGSVVFSVGCHSGLNLAFALDGASPDEAAQLADWAEATSPGSQFVGATGYGYGDTEVIALSEKLLAEYARNLASGRQTTGQALLFAKQETAAQLTSVDAYWQKTSMETVYYGIPMYKVGAGGTQAASALPPAPPAAATAPRASRTYDLAIEFDEPHETDRGTYYSVRGEDPLVIQNRPIEPKTTVDVTPADGKPVHGVQLEALTTRDVSPIDPVIARPTIADDDHEAEPPVSDVLFPAQLVGVSPEATPGGMKTRMTLVAGQTRRGVQRLITSATARVFRSDSSDFTPPTIRRVDGLVTPGGVSVTVDVLGGDEAGGIVLYRTNADATWRSLRLARIAPGRMGGGDVLPSGADHVTEALVYVHDDAGNVAESLNKVLGHAFSREVPAPGAPRVTFDPPSTGYYAEPPTIRIDPGTHAGAQFEYSVDSGPWTPYRGAFTIDAPTEGEHVVRVRGSDGSSAADRFAVDTQAPTVTGEPATLPNAFGWYREDVTVHFTCADAVSGVASCSGPVTLGEGADQTATGSATDRAGRTGSGSFGPVNVDKTKPVVTGRPDRAPNPDGWYREPVTVAWTCTDALSGVQRCPDSSTVAEGAGASVTGTGRDKAGNEATGTLGGLNVDRTDPTVAITSSGLLSALGLVTGTAADPDPSDPKAQSGVKDVVVTYTSGGTTITRRSGDGLTLTCDAPRTSCTWRADPPTVGVWQVRATSIDRAGRESTPVATQTLQVL